MRILSNIKLLILSTLLALPVLTKAVEMQEVIERLSRHHGPEWYELSLTVPTQTEIRSHLVKLINEQVDFKKKYKEYHLWQPHLKEMAINELGNFSAVDGSQGAKTLRTLKKLHQSYEAKLASGEITQNGVDSYLIAIYESISSIGSPEAIDYLIDQLGKSESYDYGLIDRLKDNFAGTSSQQIETTDYKPKLDFRPNIELPYYQRMGAWKQSFKKFRKKLTSYRNQKVSAKLKQHARSANLQAGEILAQAREYQKKLQAQSHSSEDKKVHNNRKPAAEVELSERYHKRETAAVDEHENEKSYFKYYLVILLFLIMGIYFFRKKYR